MSKEPELTTLRLRLRRWRPADLAPFADMNADPVVMEHFASGPIERERSDAFARSIEAEFDAAGYGLWAVEVPGVAPFIGFVGLHAVPFEEHFTPAVEVGWRLARDHWHHGYATEAARAAVAFGFESTSLTEVVSFTTRFNLPSQRVMERIGMSRVVDGDFDHPAVPEGHPFRRHVIYRLAKGASGARG
jgi:ribosomal-protein-alanine N-acetyltransferase